MKARTAIFLGAMLLAGSLSGHAQTPPLSANHSIGGGWSAPTGSTYCTAYGGKATTNCVNAYTVTVIPPAGLPTTPAITLTTCATGATGNCIPVGATNFSYAPGGQLYCGQWSYSVVANWLDNSGTAQASASVTATPGTAACPFTANPATGLSVTTVQ